MIDRLIVLACLMVALCPATAFSDVMVNEVMANEPGSYVQLEWIELFNNSDSAVSMATYLLDAGGTDVMFPSSLILEPEQFFIVCRRLYGDSVSPGFEDTWGDTSGVWGDTEFEAGMPVPLQATFSLRNSADTITLYASGMPISEFIWSESSDDGVSWERLTPDSDSIIQCEAAGGSSAGRVNSKVPARFDAAVEAHFQYTDYIDQPYIVAIISNVGRETLDSVTAVTHNDSGALIATETWYNLLPGNSAFFIHDIYLTGYYSTFTIEISEDDNPANNVADLTTKGNRFPPVLLSEVFPNPNDIYKSEWVELWNRSDEAYDLSEWKMGDANKSVPIADEELLVVPGEFLVLCDDSADFAASYPEVSSRVHEIHSWPTLNNDVDQVVLIEHHDFEADHFWYNEVFDDSRTWSRAFDGSRTWGRSADPGGTPGYENRITIFQDAAEVSLSFFDRQLTSGGRLQVNASAPLGHSYTLKVFDRQGRVVCTLADNADFLAESYLWNGTTDSGARLPVGLYIVHFEVPGVGSAKETVAIVR